MYEVSVEETFAAAHALRNYHGKCEPTHGHNFRVRVTLLGPELDQTGLLVDFLEVKKQIVDVVRRLDHQFLNELPPFDTLNPSAENMARYFYDQITGGMKDPATSARVGEVRIWETDVMSASFRP